MKTISLGQHNFSNKHILCSFKINIYQRDRDECLLLPVQKQEPKKCTMSQGLSVSQRKMFIFSYYLFNSPG